MTHETSPQMPNANQEKAGHDRDKISFSTSLNWSRHATASLHIMNHHFFKPKLYLGRFGVFAPRTPVGDPRVTAQRMPEPLHKPQKFLLRFFHSTDCNPNCSRYKDGHAAISYCQPKIEHSVRSTCNNRRSHLSVSTESQSSAKPS